MFHNGQEALLSAQKKYIPEIFLMENKQYLRFEHLFGSGLCVIIYDNRCLSKQK